MAIYTLNITTTGSAGAASGEATLPSSLFTQLASLHHAPILWGLQVHYNASAPATTDLVVSEVGGLGRTLLTLTNRNTDGLFYPRYAVHDGLGTEKSLLEAAILEGPLKATVSGCDALTNAVVISVQLVYSRVAD